MKIRKLCSILLALVLALSCTVPAYAEGELLSEPDQDAAEDSSGTQFPEDVVFPDDAQSPEDWTVPDDTQPPEDWPFPDDTQSPEDWPFLDDTQSPEDWTVPDDTQPPEDWTVPDGTQPPEDVTIPEDALPPEDEILPTPKEDLIEVLVPAVGEVVLNPYKLEVDTGTGTTREQVVHQPQPMVNNSGFPVIVTATATGSLASDAWFVSAPPTQDTQEKEMFLYVEFQNQPDFWSGFYEDAPNQLLVTDWPVGKDGVLTLDPFGVGYFRIFGAMSPYPRTIWSSENALSISIAYTFTCAPEDIAVDPEMSGESDPPAEVSGALEEPSMDAETPSWDAPLEEETPWWDAPTEEVENPSWDAPAEEVENPWWDAPTEEVEDPSWNAFPEEEEPPLWDTPEEAPQWDAPLEPEEEENPAGWEDAAVEP